MTDAPKPTLPSAPKPAPSAPPSAPAPNPVPKPAPAAPRAAPASAPKPAPALKGVKYIQKTLVSGEKIVYVAKLHNFAYVFPVILIVLGLFITFLPEMPDGKLPTGDAAQHVSRIKVFVLEKMEQIKHAIPEEIHPAIIWFEKARRYYFGVLFTLFGILKIVSVFIKKKTMEHVVTNKKVIRKEGLISVDTNELNLDRIESVKIHQTAFDRLIGMGHVHINGVGMEQIDLRGMKEPAELKKAILETIDRFLKK